MTCLTVLVNIADVNADFTCHLTNFWLLLPWPHVSELNLAPFGCWNVTYCFFLIYFSIKSYEFSVSDIAGS